MHRWDQVGGLRMHARTLAECPRAAGAEPLPKVVLVHGLGISSRYMVPMLRRLAGDHHVWAPDLPGIGHSARPPRPLSLAQLADVLVAWMDVVGLDRPALLGHSLGCQVAGHLADRHPRRVSALVLASPSRDPQARWPWQHAWRLIADAPREAPELLPIAVTDYLRAGPRRMWRTLREAMDTDAAARLSRIDHPTLVVRGERDPIVSGQWAVAITRLLHAGTLVTLPGAPHAVNYTTASDLADVVRPFLASHAR